MDDYHIILVKIKVINQDMLIHSMLLMAIVNILNLIGYNVPNLPLKGFVD